MDLKPCYYCGQLPTIVKVSSTWINAEHDDCAGEPGVSICDCRSVEQAITAWNRFQPKLRIGSVAVFRLKNKLQLTQLKLFED